MKIDEFVEKIKSDWEHDGETDYDNIPKLTSIIERHREALYLIANIGIMTPDKDTYRTARMREISREELAREV